MWIPKNDGLENVCPDFKYGYDWYRNTSEQQRLLGPAIPGLRILSNDHSHVFYEHGYCHAWNSESWDHGAPHDEAHSLIISSFQ